MKSNVFSHYILTRYNNGIYDREDAEGWMKHRYNLFRVCRMNMIMQQAEFKWIISMDSRTPKKWLDKIFINDCMIMTFQDIRQVFLSKEIIPDSDWVITSRMDNDDTYRDGAIQAIQDVFTPQIMVIDIDYEQFRVEDMQYGPSKRDLPNSPFLSLIEPSHRVMTCYCRPHNKLPWGYPIGDGNLIRVPIKKIEKVLANMVIHDNNMTNYWLS